MADTWDKLWAEDVPSWHRARDPPWIMKWLDTVKAEGDKFKEKAEKLDELFPNPHIIEETGGTMCELLIEQAGKLEAIRKICLTMHRVNRQKALKILDDEKEEAS